MVKKKKNKLGQQDILVLAAILHLGKTAYGVSIRQEIETKTGQKTSTATVYLALNRLQDRGFVKTRIGDAEPQRGGRRKCFYEVTRKGEAVFQDALASMMPMVETFAREWGLIS
ncbi:MAG: PadR family transcriptional regulator [Pyrinomonadaceae bacterium]